MHAILWPVAVLLDNSTRSRILYIMLIYDYKSQAGQVSANFSHLNERFTRCLKR